MRPELDIAFHPGSIAVLGASANPGASGHHFLMNVREAGYQGRLYPVTPNYAEVSGLKAYPRIGDIPGTVDFVISCVSAARIAEIIPECAAKGVKFIHLFTARFAETGDRQAIELEQNLLKLARKSGIRLIGPNCMGVHCQKSGISFVGAAPREPGNVSGISQSGSNASHLIIYGDLRGIRFNKVVSYGNALDLNENDFLEYLAEDEETRVITGYMEGLKDARVFLKILSETTLRKPVVLLKGGRGKAGAGATRSHTAALAGSLEVWRAALRQAGAIEVDSMEELLDLALAFQCLPPITGTRVGVAVGGGGMAVVSADEWEEAGFTLPDLPDTVMTRIRSELPKLWWQWLRNPLDASIIPKDQYPGLHIQLPRMMAQSPAFDLIAANLRSPLNDPDKAHRIESLDRDVSQVIGIAEMRAKPLVVVLNTGMLGAPHLQDKYWAGLAEINTRLIRAGIPVYRNNRNAARAIFRLVKYYQGNRETLNC